MSAPRLPQNVACRFPVLQSWLRGEVIDLLVRPRASFVGVACTAVALDMKPPRDETSRANKDSVASLLLSVADRLRFITRQSKEILLIDVSDCWAADVEKIIRAVPELVTTRPLGSVLILTDFKGASFDPEATRVMQETAVFDKPYVKKSAWVGAENLPQGLSESLSNFSRREFSAFKTREEALAWLAKD